MYVSRTSYGVSHENWERITSWCPRFRSKQISHTSAVHMLAVTWRGASMPWVISVFAESWGTTGLTVSNRRLLRETDSRPITCIVCERQLRLYGHVAHYPEVDPAHQVISVRGNPVWRRPRGRPQLSLLEQVDESCQELLRVGRGPAWRLARRNPRVWRRRVGGATRPLAYAPFDWLIDLLVNQLLWG